MRNSINFKENAEGRMESSTSGSKMQSDAKKGSGQKETKGAVGSEFVVGCIKVKGWKDTEKWRLDHWTA